MDAPNAFQVPSMDHHISDDGYLPKATPGPALVKGWSP